MVGANLAVDAVKAAGAREHEARNVKLDRCKTVVIGWQRDGDMR